MRAVQRFAGLALLGALALCGGAQAQEASSDAQMSEMNCVYNSILASKEDAALIGALALGASLSAYATDMADEKIAPYVATCGQKHGWSDDAKQAAKAVGLTSAALLSQAALAGEAGASKDDIRIAMSLADTLPPEELAGLRDGSYRNDPAAKEQLAKRISAAGGMATGEAMDELVRALALAVVLRDGQTALGHLLFP